MGTSKLLPEIARAEQRRQNASSLTPPPSLVAGAQLIATQQVDLLLPWVAHAAMHRLRRTLSGFGRTTSDCSNP
jgi:hypothetical protein